MKSSRPTGPARATGPQCDIETRQHNILNGAGSELSAVQSWDEGRFAQDRRPVLLVPGYGTNSHLFRFHPSGHSLDAFLIQRGFEVWHVDLRGWTGRCSA
jgi:pimeloyl-ACP methyl ester carboxylesterase